MEKDDRHLKFRSCDSRFGDPFWHKQQFDKMNSELQKLLKHCEQQQQNIEELQKNNEQLREILKVNQKKVENLESDLEKEQENISKLREEVACERFAVQKLQDCVSQMKTPFTDRSNKTLHQATPSLPSQNITEETPVKEAPSSASTRSRYVSTMSFQLSPSVAVSTNPRQPPSSPSNATPIPLISTPLISTPISTTSNSSEGTTNTYR